MARPADPARPDSALPPPARGPGTHLMLTVPTWDAAGVPAGPAHLQVTSRERGDLCWLSGCLGGRRWPGARTGGSRGAAARTGSSRLSRAEAPAATEAPARLAGVPVQMRWEGHRPRRPPPAPAAPSEPHGDGAFLRHFQDAFLPRVTEESLASSLVVQVRQTPPRAVTPGPA